MTETQAASDVMKKGYIPKMERSDCESKLQGIPVYDTYICAGGITKVDTCLGDSGKFRFVAIKNV